MWENPPPPIGGSTPDRDSPSGNLRWPSVSLSFYSQLGTTRVSTDLALMSAYHTNTYLGFATLLGSSSTDLVTFASPVEEGVEKPRIAGYIGKHSSR